LIVTTAAVGELRVAVNDLQAEDAGGNRLENNTPSLNGYSDLSDIDFVSQPSGTRLVGINRVVGCGFESGRRQRCAHRVADGPL